MAAESLVRRYRDLLRVADFRTLVACFLVDDIGTWAYSVVIALVVYDRSGGSPAWLAAQFAVRWATGLLASGYAGVIADRYERTRVIAVSAAAAAAVMSGLTVAVGLHAPVLALVALSALTAAVAAPAAPASGALLPSVVDEARLGTANSAFAVAENLVIVVGPAIGAVLLLLGAPTVGLALNAASFVVVALLVRRLSVRSTGDAEPGSGLGAQWLDGVRAIGAAPRVLVLIGYACLAEAVYGASTVVYAPLSARVGTGSDGYGYLLAASAVGSVLAAAAAERLSAARRTAAILLGATFVLCLPFLVTGWFPTAGVALAGQLVSGAGYIVMTVLAGTTLQRALPSAILGRVLGVYSALITIATLLGSFLLTPLLSGIGLVHSLDAIGVGFSAVAVLGYPWAVASDRRSAARADLIRTRVDVLRALDLFVDATRGGLERLAAAAEERTIGPGAVLIREGDPAADLYVLTSGTLSVTSTAASSPIPDVAAPGYVGEIGLMRHRTRTATVRAATECRLLRVPGAVFEAALSERTASASLLSLAGQRLSRTPA